MYYDPRKKNHNLPHDPFTALVVPRPIGWISTIGRSGIVNLAPYSFFNAVSGRPPMVMFSSIERKHSQRNAEETGEFVANLAIYELREEMNLTSAVVDEDVSEAELAGLELVPSVAVKPPRVKRSPVALECQYVETIHLRSPTGEPFQGCMIIGQVVGIHIDDSVIVDGYVDIAKMMPVSRLGYMEYTAVDRTFVMMRPDSTYTQPKKQVG
jgi:flavin reductase (DIM6/NTAB) family NADH-FMN oxidoreductase RutF